MDVRQVAVVLYRTPDTVRDLMRGGKLPGARRIRGRWLIPLADLAEVLEPTPNAPPGLPPPSLAAVRPVRRRRAIVMN